MSKCNCDYMMPTSQPLWERHYHNCKLKWNEERLNNEYPLNPDGTIKLPNPHLSQMEYDVLYHLGMDTKNYDLQALFGDVKFVCMGGTKHRMKEFAEHIAVVLKMTQDKPIVNLTKHSHRYAMYKVGPVLSVSHGIGIPSMTILLQEIIKLLSYAKCNNPVIFRIGTSGGLKVPPGSVIISSFGLNAAFEKCYELQILGKTHKLPTFFDKRICQELQSLADKNMFETFVGGTMAADDFYQGQGRIDGPFTNHSEADRLEYLNKLYDMGVRNIEMEATAFAAFTAEAGLRSADVCVTFIDRLRGDQIRENKATLLEWQKRPMLIVGYYIAQYLERE